MSEFTKIIKLQTFIFMKTIIKITSIIFIFLGVSALFFILSQWHTKTHWENATLLNDLQHVDTLDTWAYGFVGNGEFHHAGRIGLV